MITQGLCNSYKAEILTGVHTAADVYKLALFTSAANLSPATTAYAVDGETSGDGYTAGGVELTGFAVSLDGSVAVLDFNDAEWLESTITARGALIYNSSKANKAVAVFDFGSDITSVNGPFNAPMPEPTATTGAIRIK